jgi:hypothetical protein
VSERSVPATRGGPVEVRDRRDLPFFQMRMGAISAIRDEVSGPRRLRTLGLYGLLCQLANEQRHVGEHRTVRCSYDLLTTRSGIGRSQLKAMLDHLGRCGVIRQERIVDPDRGTTISVVHLLILDDPWIAVTVAMARRLAGPRDEGRFLRDLGLIVVLLEFCAAQRHDTGGLAAQVTRAQLAAHAGLAVDRLDDCNRVLQRAGVLTVTRRRPANGGRNLPSLYTIHEAPEPADQGGETRPAGRQNETVRAEDWDSQGGESRLTARQNETGRADDQDWQGGDSALEPVVSPPSNACAVGEVENNLEPLTPNAPRGRTKGGRGTLDDRQLLCTSFIEAWEPVLGLTPAHSYDRDRDTWLNAAARLLDRHTPDRLGQALEAMLHDEILAGRALTLPTFEQVCDQLLARQHARKASRRNHTPTPASHGHVSWPDARAALERAIQRYGRDGSEKALDELVAVDGMFVQFVGQVRWSVLCEQPMQFAERRYKDIWAELSAAADTREESAA